MINQIRLHQVRHSDRYKYGVKVPKNHNQAMTYNRENGNDKWRKVEELELQQISQYDSFKDLGKGAKAPPGHK